MHACARWLPPPLTWMKAAHSSTPPQPTLKPSHGSKGRCHASQTRENKQPAYTRGSPRSKKSWAMVVPRGCGAARAYACSVQSPAPRARQRRGAGDSSEARAAAARQPDSEGASVCRAVQGSSASVLQAPEAAGAGRTGVLEDDVGPPGPGGLQIDEGAQILGKPAGSGGGMGCIGSQDGWAPGWWMRAPLPILHACNN